MPESARRPDPHRQMDARNSARQGPPHVGFVLPVLRRALSREAGDRAEERVMQQQAPSTSPYPATRNRDGNGWLGIGIKDAEGLYIANMVMQPGRENELANARLLAMAPRLLSLLHTLNSAADRGDIVFRDASLKFQ